MKQYEVLKWAFSFLKKSQREENIAEMLLQHYTNQNRSQFYANMQQEISELVWQKFRTSITNHAKTGIPVQHIIGSAPFYGRDFTVNKHVLIPRFETEELVSHALDKIKKSRIEHPIIVDVGTGSGIIAITLALELEQATIIATDISGSALVVAKQNAERLGANITFKQGNFLDPIIDANINPHFIISNPPYIGWEEQEALSDTVKNFDPSLALFAEQDGLAAYEAIFNQIKELLRIDRREILVEIGYEQAGQVSNLVKSIYPHSKIETIQDVNGKDRIVSVTL